MRREVPEPWATWLVAAGFADPRARAPRPSARRLADAIGMSTTTVMNMMHGTAETEPETVEATAAALRMDVLDVSRQVGLVRTERRPYVPPAEVNLLSRRQQRALSELILAMAAEGSGHRGDTAPMTEDEETQLMLVRELADNVTLGELRATAAGIDADQGVLVSQKKREPHQHEVDELAHRRRAEIAERIAAGDMPAAARPEDD